jgi:outer membrane protein assembly factor BamB
LYGGVGKSPNVKVDWNTMNYRGVSKAVFSLDRLSGELQWISHTPASTASLTVAGESFYLCDERLKLHALDAQTGKPLWSSATGLPEGSGIAGCAYYGERLWVLYVRPIPDRRDGFYSGAELLKYGHNRRELAAFSPEDGHKLFDCDFGMTVAGFTFSGDTVYGMHQHSSGLAAVEIATGKQKWKQPRWSMKCTASLATPNCLIYRSTETSILDLGSMESQNGPGPQKTSFGGFRPTCTFAAVPANGMLYIQAPGCRCPSPIRGSMAIAPGVSPVPIESDQRLVRGEAYERPVAEDRRESDRQETDGRETTWPTWRGDRHRSGQAAEPVALPLKPAWSARLTGSLTPVSVGHGRVYCGNDAGQLVALDLRTGERQWQYLAGTAIQAAPFLWQGRIYVGDEDGWVHCVRADDGKVIWRYHAALAEDRTVGYGRYTSLWPVASGVLVHDGVAYCAAGLLPNEGAIAYALDARTGELKWSEVAQQGSHNYRTALVPGGAMAMSQRSLFIPTKQAAPWQIDFEDDQRATSTATPTLFGSRRGGPEIMAHGDELISVAQGKQYVWHVKYVVEDTTQRLPLIDNGVAYFVNRRVSGAGSCLVALAHGDDKDAKPQLLWHAWPDEPMNVMVQAADVLFSGGEKGIYATAAGDGKQLWSAPSPNEVTDLACCERRLLAVCRNGEILCFASTAGEK